MFKMSKISDFFKKIVKVGDKVKVVDKFGVVESITKGVYKVKLEDGTYNDVWLKDLKKI